MLQLLTQPNGRPNTALGFGCSSLLRIPDTEQQQRLLDIAVDGGIRHIDVARLYGLGQAEAELATNFGLGEAKPYSGAALRQVGLPRLLRAAPGLRSDGSPPLFRRHGAPRFQCRPLPSQPRNQPQPAGS